MIALSGHPATEVIEFALQSKTDIDEPLLTASQQSQRTRTIRVNDE
jgi:hypothetical protein